MNAILIILLIIAIIDSVGGRMAIALLKLWMEENNYAMPTKKDLKRLVSQQLDNLIKRRG